MMKDVYKEQQWTCIRSKRWGEKPNALVLGLSCARKR